MEADELNWLTVTTAVSVAVALPSHPIATTLIVASPINPSSHVAKPVVLEIVPASGGDMNQL